MTAYDLPVTIHVGGADFPIRCGWRAVLDALAAFNDDDMDDDLRPIAVLKIMVPSWRDIPANLLPDALHQICSFIDCGVRSDGRNHPKTMDWEQDAALIIPAINQIARQEIRLNPNIHWWTFFGWYMSIGDSLFSSVLRVRGKKAKGKKLEKWEEEFYKENKHLVDFRADDSEEVRAEKDSILKFL